MELAFTVPGLPVTQGNLTRNRYGATYDKTKGLGEWRAAVGWYARQANGHSGVSQDAFAVTLHFLLPVPKSAPKRRRIFPTPRRKFDLDKLTRAIGDSLTSIVWEDDSQICDLVVSKRYAYDEPPGVHITIRSLLLPEIDA